MKIPKLILCLLMLLNNACKQTNTKQAPNKPPKDFDFLIQKSIMALRAEMGNSGPKEIKENIALSAIVIANDRSGNFFRQIILDDGTEAIALLLDASNLYNDFPVGRRVYVRCKGLWTGFYYKLPQIGFNPNPQGFLSPLPVLLWDNFIFPAEMEEAPKAIEVRLDEISQAKSELFNRLIRLSNVQLADTMGDQAYAVAPEISSATNKSIMDCDSNTITLRNSGFARFRAAQMPKGRGSLTAIYSVFNNSPQLMIRDSNDVQFNLERCR